MLEVVISLVTILLALFGFAIYFVFNVHELLDKNKAVEEQIKLGNKIWCHYTVETATTREVLICGVKYRCFNELVLIDSYCERFGKRKIFVYEITQEINGIECVITFYANVRHSENENPYFIVKPAGEMLFNENT